MNILILIVVGVVGIVLGVYFARVRGGVSAGEAGAVRKEDSEWVEKKEKILALFDAKDRIKNDDVQNLLGVSDATATRYLQKLEDKKLIVQIGEGSASYYKRL